MVKDKSDDEDDQRDNVPSLLFKSNINIIKLRYIKIIQIGFRENVKLE